MIMIRIGITITKINDNDYDRDSHGVKPIYTLYANPRHIQIALTFEAIMRLTGMQLYP